MRQIHREFAGLLAYHIFLLLKSELFGDLHEKLVNIVISCQDLIEQHEWGPMTAKFVSSSLYCIVSPAGLKYLSIRCVEDV